jgi:ABC-type glycerol-3-phosphate transport system permease component
VAADDRHLCLHGERGSAGHQNSVLTMIVIYVTFNLPLSILLISGCRKGVSREIDSERD